ncbi:hypothetical protein PJP14_29760, partial [Mycobacterium kansasii]
MVGHSYDDRKDEWILDNGASYHMIPHRSWFTSYRECDGGPGIYGHGNAC